MRKVLSFFIEHWVRFLVAFLIGVIMMIVYLAIANAWTWVIGYCNATFISAFVLFSISILSVLNLFGAFDIFSFYIGRKKKENGAKEDLYDYSSRKKDERSKFKLVFVPYLFFALLFLVASLILYFLQ